MKTLLIIQQDSAYFLFETLQVLNKNLSAFKGFDITLLASPEAYEVILSKSIVPVCKIVTNPDLVKANSFDISFNLSLIESSWTLHQEIKSLHKVGPYLKEGQLIVPDNWSTYYLTIKGKTPFLTFHLQDFFKNILGIKKATTNVLKQSSFDTFIFGLPNPDLMGAEELERLIGELHAHYPQIKILDISEIDPIQDLSRILYVGPATLDSLMLCELGASGIFTTLQFQGFNLLPYNNHHLVVSSKGRKINHRELFSIVHSYIQGTPAPTTSYSLYRPSDEHLFGAYLNSLSTSDDSYPIYQSHVILWNFLLNLFDTHLEITQCSPQQLDLLKQNHMVLTKLIRLYDYAMSSIDTVHTEAKAASASSETIHGHLKNLAEIDTISDQISQSHIFLCPLLDFYRIKRGQNDGSTLLEQSQHSFLTYAEEHQALKALAELFSVTLNKNEVNI